MAFSFNPHTDAPTPRFINPPVEDYPYFKADASFDPRASGYSAVNAWVLAETSLLAYEKHDFIARLFPAPGRGPLAGFTFESVSQDEDSGCFLLHRDDCIIVAFRGTRVPGLVSPAAFKETFPGHLKDVVTDIQFKPKGFKRGRVHHGFLEAYVDSAPDLPQKIRDKIGDRETAVWFTGHSMGGALANLAVADLGDFQGLYTYGCPRVGDEDFAEDVQDRHYRFVHHDDLIARVPPPLELPGPEPITYTHAGSVVFIDRNGAVRVGVAPASRSLKSWQE